MPRGRPSKEFLAKVAARKQEEGKPQPSAQAPAQEAKQPPEEPKVKQSEFLPDNIVKRLEKLDQQYTRYHSAGKNIIDDVRLSPSKRFFNFVHGAMENGYSAREASEYAIKHLESQGVHIAGNWGKVDWDSILGGEE